MDVYTDCRKSRIGGRKTARVCAGETEVRTGKRRKTQKIGRGKGFERFATTAKWEKTGWASKLSALLPGRALEVYSGLSEEAAQDYDRVKLALMKRYDLTEDGYRRKFRASEPEVDKSPEQFIVRLDKQLVRTVEH